MNDGCHDELLFIPVRCDPYIPVYFVFSVLSDCVSSDSSGSWNFHTISFSSCSVNVEFTSAEGPEKNGVWELSMIRFKSKYKDQLNSQSISIEKHTWFFKYIL